MRYFMIALLATFWLSPLPVWALEQPTTHQTERAAYPSVTPQGLEDLRLGAALPSHSEFPGLTYRAIKVPDYDEGGRAIARTFLKVYHKGFYLGQGMLDPQGRLVELQVHFSPESYDTKKQLKGSFTPLSLDALPANAKATRLRLFWIPNE